MAKFRARHTFHSPALMTAMIVRRSVNSWQSLTNSSEYSIAPTITSNREGSIVCSVNDWKTTLILSRRLRYGITTLNFTPPHSLRTSSSVSHHLTEIHFGTARPTPLSPVLATKQTSLADRCVDGAKEGSSLTVGSSSPQAAQLTSVNADKGDVKLPIGRLARSGTAGETTTCSPRLGVRRSILT